MMIQILSIARLSDAKQKKIERGIMNMKECSWDNLMTK